MQIFENGCFQKKGKFENLRHTLSSGSALLLIYWRVKTVYAFGRLWNKKHVTDIFKTKMFIYQAKAIT